MNATAVRLKLPQPVDVMCGRRRLTGLTASWNFCNAVIAMTARAPICRALQRRLCGIVEIAMQRGNDLRALTDRAADAFDRPRAHIANRENARYRRLEH